MGKESPKAQVAHPTNYELNKYQQYLLTQACICIDRFDDVGE